MKNHRSERIRHSLYSAFVIEGRYDIAAVAARIEKSASWLYKVLEGSLSMKAEDLDAILDAVDDPRLVAEVFDFSRRGWVVTERPSVAEASSVHRGGLRLGIVAGQAQHVIHEAMADGVIDQSERVAVGKALDDVNVVTEQLRRKVVKA